MIQYHWFGSFLRSLVLLLVIILCMVILKLFHWSLSNNVSEVTIMKLHGNINHNAQLGNYMLLFACYFFIITLKYIPYCSRIVLIVPILFCNILMAFLCCPFSPWCLNEQYLLKTVVYIRIKFFIWWQFGPYNRDCRRVQAKFKLLLHLFFKF